MLKLAFHTYAFGARSWLPAWTLDEAIRITAELGFEGLELAACRPHGWPSDLDATRRQAIRKLAADCGLAFSAVCPVAVNHNIASPVTEERKSTVGYLVECLDLALDLGCRTMVVNGGWSVQPYGRDEAWRWAAEGLAVVAHEAEHRDVAVALENINSQRADVVVTSRDVTAMVNEVGSLALRPMIDFYHLHLEGEDPLEAIDRFGDSLAYTHFLDARLVDRARLAPGWGEMPLPAILAALRQVGYNDWLGYEIWGDDPLTLGRRAVSFFAEQQQQLS